MDKDLEIQSLKNKITAALNVAYINCGLLGDEYAACWIIDQMVRALHNDINEYESWIKDYCSDGTHWEEGVEP